MKTEKKFWVYYNETEWLFGLRGCGILTDVRLRKEAIYDNQFAQWKDNENQRKAVL